MSACVCAYECMRVSRVCVCISAGSIPGFVRYRSIPEFCSILDTYVVSLIFT